jgi:hypothetical protein
LKHGIHFAFSNLHYSIIIPSTKRKASQAPYCQEARRRRFSFYPKEGVLRRILVPLSGSKMPLREEWKFWAKKKHAAARRAFGNRGVQDVVVL